MDIKWTKSAMKCVKQIQSRYFTADETKIYKKWLIKEIERKVSLIMTSIPAIEHEWKGTYRVFVDKYKVYYSFSEDKKTCYIEAFKHQHQI